MKAAVITKFGDVPRYEDFPDPPISEGDLRVTVKAAALENFDKMAARGEHYSSKHLFPQFPAIVGHGGIGVSEDGALIAFGGIKPPYGTMAEKAVVPKEYKQFATAIPEGVDAAVAAALPASALTSFLPLKYGAKLQSGETVLINGATGVSGKLAVQIAKLLGAGRIVGTGRSEEGLRSVRSLGADVVIDIKKSDGEVEEAFAKESGKGYDVILDFLWGHPTELLLKTLVPKEAGFAQRRVRFVQIGEAAGPTISLPAEAIRTSGVEITGAGDISPEVVPEAVAQVWDLIKENRLHIDIERVPLKDIADAWARKTEGKRIVVVPS